MKTKIKTAVLAKLRSKSFWTALAGALALLFARVGVSDASAAAQQVVEAVGGVLLLLGIVVSPVPKEEADKASEPTQEKACEEDKPTDGEDE